ncbi:chaperonin GroES [Kitasatospora sp. MAP12-15]|uniref:co-chaperone GroES n=1 Tax=unclassified Kitasatospora TaxID=2633591 RepID=UPI002475D9FA|nr:hypothetical protein [Kitasatospora sp. MAP12-44]MDH6108702.1 chaperonin GroES [Kitasatospora sp. MAP12-44]
MPEFHPKHDHLIVKPIENGSGQGDAETRTGEVMAVGPGRLLGGGKPHPVDVKVGEKVLYNTFSGVDLDVDGVAYAEIPEDEILAVTAE